jgi:predicted nucleic acid-binding protein
VIGTLGILTTAAEKGLITLSDAIDDLKQTSFRASDRVLELLARKESE